MNSSCIPDVGYFASQDFVSTALHTNTLISTPIHFFGFYCILFKTTQQMKSVKPCLVNLHVWVVLFDYSFSILTIPFILIPHLAGHPLGILKLFGVSTLVQTVLVFVVLANMLVSTTMVFENRFFSVCTFPGRELWKKLRRSWALGYHVVGSIWFCSWFLFAPDQATAKKNVYEKLPCLPRKIYEADNYVVSEEITYPVLTCVVFFITFGVKVLSLAFYLLWNTMSQLKQRTMSHKTYQLHKSFFLAISTQIMVPCSMFAVPVIYIWVAIIFGYYNQSLTNIAVTLLSMHGFTSSLVMIFAHRPYRKSLLELIKKMTTKPGEQ